jgi:hypothetical protein
MHGNMNVKYRTFKAVMMKGRLNCLRTVLKAGVGIRVIESLGSSTRVRYLEEILKHVRGPEHIDSGKATCLAIS